MSYMILKINFLNNINMKIGDTICHYDMYGVKRKGFIRDSPIHLAFNILMMNGKFWTINNEITILVGFCLFKRMKSNSSK